jgi:hypothetical protein
VLVDIAQRDNLNRGDLEQAEEIALTVPPAANYADSTGSFTGKESRVRCDREQGEAGGAALEELSAVHGLSPTFVCAG